MHEFEIWIYSVVNRGLSRHTFHPSLRSQFHNNYHNCLWEYESHNINWRGGSGTIFDYDYLINNSSLIYNFHQTICKWRGGSSRGSFSIHIRQYPFNIKINSDDKQLDILMNEYQDWWFIWISTLSISISLMLILMIYVSINDDDWEYIFLMIITTKANDCDRGLAAYIFTTDYAQVV